MRRIAGWFRILSSSPGIAPSYTRGMASRAMVALGLAGAAAFGLSLAHREPVATRSGITIVHPWSKGGSYDRKTLPAYMTIENKGGLSDRLLEVRTPMAERILFRRFERRGRTVLEVEVPELQVGPKSRLVMRPGEMQIMLYGLSSVIQPGDVVPLTLSFEMAGTLEVAVKIESLGEREHADHF